MHEHVQPGRDDRRRVAREEGRRAGSRAQAVGQDEPCPRFEGRDRVLREGRPHHVPRGPRVQHRGLRLHDVHRELRPAARGGLAGRRRRRPRRLRRALGQPQLRGPHPSRGEGELPGLAAARRRLRARRADGHRHHDRAARPRPAQRRAGLPGRHLALACRGARDDGERDRTRHVPRHLRERLRGGGRLARAAGADRRAVRLGGHLHLRAPAAVLRRHGACPPGRSPTSAALAAWSRSATRSRPTTSRRRARSSSTRLPAATSSTTASRRATSTPTARGAATTR